MFLGLEILCKNQEAEEKFDGTERETQQTFARPWIFTFQLKLRVNVQVKDRTQHEEGLHILNRHHSEAGWTSRQPADVSGAR